MNDISQISLIRLNISEYLPKKRNENNVDDKNINSSMKKC